MAENHVDSYVEATSEGPSSVMSVATPSIDCEATIGENSQCASGDLIPIPVSSRRPSDVSNCVNQKQSSNNAGSSQSVGGQNRLFQNCKEAEADETETSSVDDTDPTRNGMQIEDLEKDMEATHEVFGGAATADETQLEEKFLQLLQKTDTYSRKLMGGLTKSGKLKWRSKNDDGSGVARSHVLTEAEEDDILLMEAETDEELAAIMKQPDCIMGTMKSYQIEGLNWLHQIYKLQINGILADEMGLGKTLQTISILGYLLTEKNVRGPHLVICPRSTLENWKHEITKWCPILRVVRFHGKKEERNRLFEEELNKNAFDVCLTTYEMVIKEKARLTRYGWTYLIMDEAHRIKNEKSVLSEVVRMFKPQRRLLITGTPLQNNLKELWALLNFLMPQVFDNSEDFTRFFDFTRTYANQQNKIVTFLHKILRPFMLRRLKSDVEQDLPPKREVFVFIGMSQLQKKIYSEILSKNVEVLNAMTGNKTQMLNILMQLRKCCNHPYLFDGVEPGPPYVEGTHIVESSGKMVVLDKLLPRIKQEGSRVLLFSQMTRLIDIVDDYCRWKGYEYCRIDGSTPGVERQERIDEFNAPNSNKFIFLLSTRAGGLGINLATADTVILYDSDFNPQMDLQAMDRAHRIGQKKKVTVYRFVVKECVEERIVERARKKLMLESLVIQKGRLSDYSKSQETQELHEMIQFGAQEVYRSQDESSIFNADIDMLLAEAIQRTEDIESKMNSWVNNFDLSSMSLDGGLHMYGEQENSKSDKKKLKLQRGLEFFDLGDRKTKWKGKMNQEEKKPRKMARRQLTGWRAEIQGGYDFQFFDHKKLDELDRIQHNWNKWLEKKRKQREERELMLQGGGIIEDLDSDGASKKARIETLDDTSVASEADIQQNACKAEEDTSDTFSECPTLKDLSAEQLRRLLHVLEFHIGQNHDYTSKKTSQLYRRCKELIAPLSTDEIVFSKCNFNDALTDLEAMLNGKKEWTMQIPACAIAHQSRLSSVENKVPLTSSTEVISKSSPIGSSAVEASSSKETAMSLSDIAKQPSAMISSPHKSSQRRVSSRLKRKEWDLEDEENDPSRPCKFTPEMQRRKERLISQGFINWNRTEVSKLVNAIILYGKDRINDVWLNAFKMGNKSLKDVKRYVDIFFERYHEIEGGEKMMSRIKKAELERGAILRQNEAILQNVEKQIAKGLTRPQDLQLPVALAENKNFTEDEDKVLLWSLYEHGSTAYEKIHVATRYYWYSTRGFFSIATKTLKMVEERCTQIVAGVEQEWLQQQKASRASKGNSRSRAIPASGQKSRDTNGNHVIIINNNTITHSGSKSLSSSVSHKSPNASRSESPPPGVKHMPSVTPINSSNLAAKGVAASTALLGNGSHNTISHHTANKSNYVLHHTIKKNRKESKK